MHKIAENARLSACLQLVQTNILKWCAAKDCTLWQFIPDRNRREAEYKLPSGVQMQRSIHKLQFDTPTYPSASTSIEIEHWTSNKDSATITRTTQSELPDARFCDLLMDDESATLWIHLKANAPSKFTMELIDDLSQIHDSIGAQIGNRLTANAQTAPRYQVLASRIPGIFSLGGDLALFRDCIASGDTHSLTRYAHAAVSLVYASANAYNNKVTTIALLQGQTLGGGFEAALAAQVLVAERSAKMAFPEVLFNMFPGMGAYQLLCRRLSPREAEQLILSGRTYTALELHALGVIDVLAEDGEGEAAVRRYIRTHDRQYHGRQGFRRAVQATSPLDRNALHEMADVWVETAMGLSPRDLETIDYLLRAQQRHRNAANDADGANGADALRRA